MTKKNSYAAWILAGVFTVLLMAAAPLWGQQAGPGTGNIKVGPLEVHPYLGLTETYSSNIYLNYGGRPSKSDYITTATPGILLLLPLQRHTLKAEYRADANWFSTYSETNYTNQRVGGALDLDFPMGLTFHLSDYFADARIPRKGPDNPGAERTDGPFSRTALPGQRFKRPAQIPLRGPLGGGGAVQLL